MTPREALTIVERENPHPLREQALAVLEKLVRKDEADKAFAEEVKTAARGFRPTCTCGTHIPCIMWGHS